MTDVHSPAIRSYNMSRIKGKNTKPEMLVRRFLFSKGYRYRLHDKNLPGNPDIVLAKYNTVIFINGCFWHGHNDCKYFIIPRTNTKFWLDKISTNKKNDFKNFQKLLSLNWKVITIFECQLHKNIIDSTLSRLIDSIQSASN